MGAKKRVKGSTKSESARAGGKTERPKIAKTRIAPGPAPLMSKHDVVQITDMLGSFSEQTGASFG